MTPDQATAMLDDFASLSLGCERQASTASGAYFAHSSAQRINTDAVLASTIRAAHPGLHLTIVPAAQVDIISFAAATGKVRVSPLPSDNPSVPDESLTWRSFAPAARRLDGEGGNLTTRVFFAKYAVAWDDVDLVMYVANGRDGEASYPSVTNQYVLSAQDGGARAKVDSLIRAVGSWANTLHGEIWVFDGGAWQKDAALWRSVAKARWEDVILSDEQKAEIRQDANSFFNGRERYERLRVGWKRGVIYYGPPGNGKTISIKALMKELYARKPVVQTLYVRSLASFGGPEYSVKQIFAKARREAPCLLVFEDLDSIVDDRVRSYFLNEVDGLQVNEGVLMIGSTNHLDRLDPGISKRPSRFDRKYLFSKPDYDQRMKYADYWRHKLDGERRQEDDDEDEDEDLVDLGEVEIEFPEELCSEMARITDEFSFAYLNEAFVASLLAIAARGEQAEDSFKGGKDKFDRLVLWREFKRQVKILREQL